MNIKSYLERINFRGSHLPNYETLCELQKTHLLNVPFENLDIHYDKEIILNINKIFQKIVTNKRGGFCYELNGLFYELLHALNFTVKMISARVYNNNKVFEEEYDHLALIVSIEGDDYLVDVGFGDFILFPLKIDLGLEQNDTNGIFIIEKYDNEYLQVSKILNDEIMPQYIFTTSPRELEEFKSMCHYNQTSPNSHFTYGKLISIQTLNGRITLTDKILKIRANTLIKKTTILDDEDFRKKMLVHFTIKELS